MRVRRPASGWTAGRQERGAPAAVCGDRSAASVRLGRAVRDQVAGGSDSGGSEPGEGSAEAFLEVNDGPVAQDRFDGVERSK